MAEKLDKARKSQRGIVFRASDGSSYFIRNELLEACKVQPDEEELVEEMLGEAENQVGRFGVSFIQPVQYSRDRSKIAIQPNLIDKAVLADRLKAAVPETVMCCW